MKVHELRYSNTNTYLIESNEGKILFDTGWAGSFPVFCKFMGELGVSVQSIDYIIISHFHPDHMGIAQDIAELGPDIVVLDVQKDYVHSSDNIFAKDKNVSFKPIDDDKVISLNICDSRAFLKKKGFDGEIIYTPGHSDDSISLWLDEGALFVGDLNPLYELELHKGTLIEKSWEKLLELRPKKVYYGHAKAAAFGSVFFKPKQSTDLYALVSRIMKYIDKGMDTDKIQSKTGCDKTFIEDVSRMYLTHTNVGVQGILDRIEIKGR